MAPPVLTSPSGEQQVTQGQAANLQAGQRAQDAFLTAKTKITGVLTPGWVILALGASGYLLSETRIFGPILAILLAIATIFQLNQYTQQKGGKLL